MVGMNKIKEFGLKIGREFKAEKVILFGSYAYGCPLSTSDVDVLAILHFKGKSTWKSIEILNQLNPDFPVDLLVRTPKQVQQRLEWNDFFIKEIVTKGKVLYEARH